MIVIDAPVKSSVSKETLKKLRKKPTDKKINFSSSLEVRDIVNANLSEDVANIGSMLFLQEIDNDLKERKDVNEFAKKAFKHLKALQLSLIENNLSAQHLYNLRESLNNTQTRLSTPELEQLTNEIKTRIEVEIAKIEKLPK